MIELLRNNVPLRRGAFILANVATLIGFWVVVIWPLQDFFASRDAQLSQRRVALARFQAIAAQRSAVERLVAQSAADGRRAEFLEGIDDSVAAANLQTMLKDMVDPTGAHLRSISALSAKPMEGTKLIGAQLEMTGTINAVYQTVHTIETAKPFLFIVGAQLKPTQQAAVSYALSRTEPTIDAQLDVVGGLQGEGGR
jgi:hypothetical protein